MIDKFQVKLDHFLGLAYHQHGTEDRGFDKEVMDYARDHPEFKKLMEEKAGTLDILNRCVVSQTKQKYLTKILEKLNG